MAHYKLSGSIFRLTDGGGCYFINGYVTKKTIESVTELLPIIISTSGQVCSQSAAGRLLETRIEIVAVSKSQIPDIRNVAMELVFLLL